MYYTVTVFCWCMELGHQSWMRLTYRRDLVADRDLMRDFLVSAVPVAAAESG